MMTLVGPDSNETLRKTYKRLNILTESFENLTESLDTASRNIKTPKIFNLVKELQIILNETTAEYSKQTNIIPLFKFPIILAIIASIIAGIIAG